MPPRDPAAPPAEPWSFRRFALWSALVAAAVLAVAWAPNGSWWPGVSASEALIVACAASLLASLAGGLVIANWPPPAAGGEISPVLAALAVRVATLVALALALALAGPWPRAPLLVWAAVAHLALLPVDSVYAVKTVRWWAVARAGAEARR